MRMIVGCKRFVVLAVLVACQLPLTSLAQAGSSVQSLTLNPAVIAGGSGDAATGTIILSAPAPIGGALIQLASSNSALAASRPSVTVPAGATTVTFPVATNALYRRYSRLDFSATISASANGSSASAVLRVIAQPAPADILSDSGLREGSMCGGIFPARRGDAGILYQCKATGSSATSGACSFVQECQLGCQRNPPDGFKFKDACASSGRNPVALNASYVTSGDRPAGTLLLDAPAPSSASGVAYVQSLDASVFPYGYQTIAAGATSRGFEVATSALPAIEFAPVVGNIFYTSSNQRIGQAWLTMAPPDPAPTQPVPTLAELDLVGPYPVTGGQIAYVTVIVSGISPSARTITLSSSNPAIATVPATVTVPAGSNWAQALITIPSPAAATTLTITATDGRYTFSGTLTVQP